MRKFQKIKCTHISSRLSRQARGSWFACIPIWTLQDLNGQLSMFQRGKQKQNSKPLLLQERMQSS